ncbi:hypothetical protein [Piscinibacter gummiphilus]|nr:hypothetical protein [Piscinibacter gummiphilus]GLS98076.1 hypothetical protein GCM10007918_53680 [Piscinibacter gummiphilus]
MSPPSSRWLNPIAALLLLVGARATAAAQPLPRDEPAFTAHMATVFQAEAGDIPVRVKAGEPLTLEVDRMQVNLDRLYNYCLRVRGNCADQATTFAKAMKEMLTEAKAPMDKAAIRLVVRPREYLGQVPPSADGSGSTLQTRPLVDGLITVVVLDTPRALRPILAGDLPKLGVTAGELFQLAEANLVAALRPLGDVTDPVRAGKIGVVGGDVYEVGRLALVGQWTELAVAQGGTLLVVLPTTDVVLYISEATPAAIEALRGQSRRMAGRAPNPLAPEMVLRWAPTGWQLVP